MSLPYMCTGYLLSGRAARPPPSIGSSGTTKTAADEPKSPADASAPVAPTKASKKKKKRKGSKADGTRPEDPFMKAAEIAQTMRAMAARDLGEPLSFVTTLIAS